MATKRFTDIEKWKKKFIKSLPPEYKLLWFYILDDCDNSGVWHVDLEVASIRIGAEVVIKTALELFKENIEVFDSGEKWYIKDFIFFQCGCYPSRLNEKNNAHLSIIRKVRMSPLKDLIEGLERSQLAPQEKEEEKDMEVDREQDKDYKLEIVNKKLEIKDNMDNVIESIDMNDKERLSKVDISKYTVLDVGDKYRIDKAKNGLRWTK